METRQANDSGNSQNIYARVPLNIRDKSTSPRVAEIKWLFNICIARVVCWSLLSCQKWTQITQRQKSLRENTAAIVRCVCKSVGRGQETEERPIWNGGMKVQWLNETKEVCKKCQKYARPKKEEGEKRNERSRSMRRNFWRIDWAFPRWDWAKSRAEPHLRCPVDGWCIRLLVPTAPASNTHFLNTTWAHFPPH